MDEAILLFFNQTLANPLLDWVMLGATTIGLGALFGLGFVLSIGSQRRVGLAILAALGAGLIIVLALQFIILRPRPQDMRFIWPTPNFPSYPSGHTAASFSVAIILMLAYRRWVWWLVAIGGALMISLSRLYLGHHYPSDVVGGFILGTSLGLAAYGLITLAKPGEQQWQWLLWPQIALVLLATHMAYLGILPYYLLRWSGADKVLHFLLFGGVVFWLNIWLKDRRLQLNYLAIPLAILIPLIFATIEELLQAFSPLRTLDVGDLTCGVLGMVFFWWVSALLINK